MYHQSNSGQSGSKHSCARHLPGKYADRHRMCPTELVLSERSCFLTSQLLPLLCLLPGTFSQSSGRSLWAFSRGEVDMLIQRIKWFRSQSLGSNTGSAKILLGPRGWSLPFYSPSFPHTPVPLSQPLPSKARLHRIRAKPSSSQTVVLSRERQLFPSRTWQLVVGKADVWV